MYRVGSTYLDNWRSRNRTVNDWIEQGCLGSSKSQENQCKLVCSKSFNLGFRSTLIQDFWMYKLHWEKAEETEIKLHSLDHGESKETPGGKKKKTKQHTYFCFIDYAKAFVCMDHNKLWEILKEMGIPDHLTCSLRNLYVGQEATVRTLHGTKDRFKIGKGMWQGCILSPCLFNLYTEYIMQNAGLDESQAGIKTAKRNINNLSYASDTTFNSRKLRGTKQPLDEGERGEKIWLKTQFKKLKSWHPVPSLHSK